MSLEKFLRSFFSGATFCDTMRARPESTCAACVYRTVVCQRAAEAARTAAGAGTHGRSTCTQFVVLLDVHRAALPVTSRVVPARRGARRRAGFQRAGGGRVCAPGHLAARWLPSPAVLHCQKKPFHRVFHERRRAASVRLRSCGRGTGPLHVVLRASLPRRAAHPPSQRRLGVCSLTFFWEVGMKRYEQGYERGNQ